MDEVLKPDAQTEDAEQGDAEHSPISSIEKREEREEEQTPGEARGYFHLSFRVNMFYGDSFGFGSGWIHAFTSFWFVLTLYTKGEESIRHPTWWGGRVEYFSGIPYRMRHNQRQGQACRMKKVPSTMRIKKFFFFCNYFIDNSQ